jgi:hypothetical protein
LAPTTLAAKAELFSLNLKSANYNIITFQEDVCKKVVSREAAGHQTVNIDLIGSIFMA